MSDALDRLPLQLELHAIDPTIFSAEDELQTHVGWGGCWCGPRRLVTAEGRVLWRHADTPPPVRGGRPVGDELRDLCRNAIWDQPIPNLIDGFIDAIAEAIEPVIRAHVGEELAVLFDADASYAAEHGSPEMAAEYRLIAQTVRDRALDVSRMA